MNLNAETFAALRAAQKRKDAPEVRRLENLLAKEGLRLAWTLLRTIPHPDDPEDTEDVALMSLLKAIRGYDPGTGDFAPYLAQVLRNDFVRERDRRGRDALCHAARAGNGIPAPQEPSFEEMLEGLTAKEKRLLRRYFVQNESLVRLGARAGRSREYARARIAAALEKLRKGEI